MNYLPPCPSCKECFSPIATGAAPPISCTYCGALVTFFAQADGTIGVKLGERQGPSGPAAEMMAVECFDQETKNLRRREVIARNRLASDAQWSVELGSFAQAHCAYHGVSSHEYLIRAAGAGVCTWSLSRTAPSAAVDFERRNSEEVAYASYARVAPVDPSSDRVHQWPVDLLGNVATRLLPDGQVEVAMGRMPPTRSITDADEMQRLRDENTTVLADNARKQRQIEDLERKLRKATR
jgi:hypothetical protein